MSSTSQKPTLSFYRKIIISLGLTGIIPILFVIQLVLGERLGERLFTTNTWFLSSALVLFSILLGFSMLRQSADQLQSLARETATAVDNGGTLPPVRTTLDGELKEISDNFNMLLEQLSHANRDIRSQNMQLLAYTRDLADSYEKIQQEEELRNNLCRYISNDLVETLMQSNHDGLLPNQRKPVTVMFADIRSFTALAEHMEPEEVVTMLNQYFSIMVDIVFKHNGMLDKLVGDQLMAIFGHMSSESLGANDAVQAAQEMQDAVQELMRTRNTRNLPTFDIGIGINTGNAIFAHVGSENRMDYTVIGDTVNAAARLENHARGGETVIGLGTYTHLPETLLVGSRAELKVKNRSQPVTCFTITNSQDETYTSATAEAQSTKQTIPNQLLN